MPSDKTKPLRVIQITDSHLFADAARELNGLNTFHSLQHVMKSVLKYNPDLIVFTGDIVDLAEAEAYLKVKSILENIAVPVFCIPGNHDDPELLKQQLVSELIRVDDSVVLKHWQLIFLNSFLPNTHRGRLDKRQLQKLEQHLEKYPQHSALICLHHHPVPIGSRWMDAMGLDKPEQLFDVIDRYNQVKGIIWGHIHQEFQQVRRGVKLLGSPSTCVQFQPLSESFCLDDKPPGFRWLNLQANGELETGVRYLDDYSSYQPAMGHDST